MPEYTFEIQPESRVYAPYGPYDFTPGSNFFFVIVPPGRHNWAKKVLPAMQRFASATLGRPFQTKIRSTGRYDRLFVGVDGYEEVEWRAFFKNWIDGKNQRIWTVYDPATKSLKEIKTPKTP